MTAERMTRTYEGRVPAKPMIEKGALWIPVAHHIEGVFENSETHTTVTFAKAQGTLADETLALVEEYRTLSQQVEHHPHPGDHFEMQPIPTLPSWVGTPVERAGWQLYTPNDEIYTSGSDNAQSGGKLAYYRLSPKAHTPPQEALEQFEAAIVTHGRSRIRLKQVNDQMRANAKTLRDQLQPISKPDEQAVAKSG